MNATELAEIIEHLENAKYIGASKAATMLRQQQSEIERLIMLCDCMTTESNRKGNEIEALKQIIDANNLSQNIGQFVKPTNEPVAWRCKKFYETQEGWFYNENEIGEPLYTHPVKELTDEEISEFTHRMVLCCGVHPNSADINVLGLKFIVEEILRKAQEK